MKPLLDPTDTPPTPVSCEAVLVLGVMQCWLLLGEAGGWQGCWGLVTAQWGCDKSLGLQDTGCCSPQGRW